MRLKFAALFRNLGQRLVPAAALVVVATVVAAQICVFAWTARYVWAIHKLARGVGDTVFEDARGRPWFRMDEQRHDVSLPAISTWLQRAVLAIEDRRFYRHMGIDPIGLARALFRDVRAGAGVEGGSTLTQQLARTLFLTNQRTVGRKLKEAALALMMETQLPKDRILELYLNRVYLSGGYYGVEPMAENLFGKHANDLDLAESAMIAGLIRAPSTLSPWTNYNGALRRSHVVLSRMLDGKFVEPGAQQAALAEQPRIRPYPGAADAHSGYAKEFLRQQFRDVFGGDHPPDWKVRTSFLLEIQDAAERAVTHGLARFHNQKLQAALVALDPRTGDILAMVGGRDFHDSQFNRALRSKRQPGSAFKPILYAAALEHGYSPVSTLTGLNDVSVPMPGLGDWTPRNVSTDSPDEITLRQALLESNNRAAVALEQKVSTRPVLRLASSLGLRDLPDVPALALGAGLVTPLELTRAFAAFANGGEAVKSRALIRVVDADGSKAFEGKVERGRVISEQAAFQMVTMLQDVLERGTGAAARGLGVTFPAAGKTGTTNDAKDVWFVGFTPSVVAGIWVGFDDPAPIGRSATGARIALPIWAEFMRQAARVSPGGDFRKPDGIQEELLCHVSYLRPMETCPTYVEYFKRGDSIPSRLCPIHGGSLKQRAHRAVQGFFAALGEKLKGIFK